MKLAKCHVRYFYLKKKKKRKKERKKKKKKKREKKKKEKKKKKKKKRKKKRKKKERKKKKKKKRRRREKYKNYMTYQNCTAFLSLPFSKPHPPQTERVRKVRLLECRPTNVLEPRQVYYIICNSKGLKLKPKRNGNANSLERKCRIRKQTQQFLSRSCLQSIDVWTTQIYHRV